MDSIPSLVKSGNDNNLEVHVITGIANITSLETSNTLFDSCINCTNGLECCADSKAITLSTDLFLIGNLVEMEFIWNILLLLFLKLSKENNLTL